MPRLQPIFEALNAVGARYVVIGGVATVLHGIASLSDLIHIKRLAGRTQDLEDVRRLEEIRRLKEQAEP